MRQNQPQRIRRKRVLAAVAVAAVVAVLSAVTAHTATVPRTIYFEDFSADLTGVDVANQGPGADWHFRDNCPSSHADGHSVPGTARWGNPSHCADYGRSQSRDSINTPSIDVSDCVDDLSLSLNYNMEFREHVNGSLGMASVWVVADEDWSTCSPTGATCRIIDFSPSWHGKTAVNNDGEWHNVAYDFSFFAGTRESIVVHIEAEPGGYTGVYHLGEGLTIDDIAVRCRTARTLDVVGGRTVGQVQLAIQSLTDDSPWVAKTWRLGLGLLLLAGLLLAGTAGFLRLRRRP